MKQQTKFKQTEIGEIPEDWELRETGDFVDVEHGYAFKGEYFCDEPNQNILLTPGNFNIGGGFKKDKLKYTKETSPIGYILKEGDIIVTMTDLSKEGDTLGYSAKVPASEDEKYLHNQRIGLLKFKSKEIFPNFLYWMLRTKRYNQFIVGSATGSTVKHTSPNRIKQFKFGMPFSLNEQQAIAKILSSLDTKIELNQEMNKTLETIGQALFKHWFIDFEFPNEKGEPFKSSGGEMVDSELGEIPKGWKVGSIYDIADVVYGAPFSSKLFNKEERGLPLIRIRDLKDSNPTFYTDEKHPKGTIINAGDIIAGMDAEFRPHIWFGEKSYLNQRLCLFKPKDQIHKYFILRTIKPLLDFFENAKVGTTVIHLGKSDIDTWRIVVPSEGISKLFSKIIDGIFYQMVNNSQETKNLSQIRDSLLPQLMSGKIRVNLKNDKQI